MRYPQHRSPSRTSSVYPFIKWAVIFSGIIGAIVFLKDISSSSVKNEDSGLILSGSGKVVIMDQSGKKSDVLDGDTFIEADSMLSVISGMASLRDDSIEFWLDKGASIDANELSASGDTLEIFQGRLWLEAQKNNTIKLKHITAKINPGSVSLMEQQKIHSIVYALKGDILIETAGGKTYTLPTGKRMMVSQSDLVNPGIELSSLADTIDDSIKQTALFLARDGEKLFNPGISGTSTEAGASGMTLTGSGGTGGVITANNLGGKVISIVSPLDGALIMGGAVTVEGKILSPDVSKIIVNDKEVSKNNNGGWVLANLPMMTDSLDLVYKAYDLGGNLLERGVITVYASEKKQGTDKLIPTTFPTSDANYRILSPSENPYKTNTSAITVSGSVPKGTVSYITVNNFRLKKFIPNTTSWYYYANTAYGTMKEGFNLYEIKFFDANNSLLSTQLFTIIKEGNSSTLSGE